MNINLANGYDLDRYISLEICAKDVGLRLNDLKKKSSNLFNIIRYKRELSEFMAVRYLQDRLREYWAEFPKLSFLRLLKKEDPNISSLPKWVLNGLNNGEKIYFFDVSQMTPNQQKEIRRVGIFLMAMAEEYIDQVISFSRKTGRPAKLYLDYLKGKHDYPTYVQALRETQKWESDELKQNIRIAKEAHVMDLPNGYYAVQLLNAAALKWEGHRMANCLSDELEPYLAEVEKPDPKIIIYSIRNSRGIPRVNVTFRPNISVISDCSGKANDNVHPVDAPIVAAFVNALNIPMRVSAARQARLLRSEGKYYDIFHLPHNKHFYDSTLNLEGLELTELPHLENLTLTGPFMCAHNHLRNLKGAPKVIHGGFSFYDNPIESLDGFPDSVESVVSPVPISAVIRQLSLAQSPLFLLFFSSTIKDVSPL